MKPLTKVLAYTVTFEDLLFLNRNKEYGAYVLRKSYKMHLTIACILTIIFFSIGISTPLFLKKDAPVIVEKTTSDEGVIFLSDFTMHFPKPNVGNQESYKKPSGGSQVDFKQPIVTSDNIIANGDVPTKEQLKNANPSTITMEGEGGIINPTSKYVIPEPVEEKPESIAEKEHIWVEEMPSYPGGDMALYSVVTANITYPELARKSGITGKVLLSFVIEKDGSISNIRIEKGIGGGCDEVAAKAVLMLTKWKPGIQNGMPVRVRMLIPIFFKLG